jgi:hypothetical protein
MRLQETAIIKIVYRWRKFVKKKKLKRMKALEKQAERDRKYPYKNVSSNKSATKVSSKSKQAPKATASAGKQSNKSGTKQN